MKTEKAIQVLRDYNLWRRGNEDMEQPDPREIGEAIDDVLMAIQKAEAELDEERKEGEEQARLLGMGSEREAKLIAERDLWRAEAQRWREQALDLEAQIETAIKRIQWRQDNLDRGIKELKGDY
jgi:regulator of protease activity HflC (stomatin/prohibitin superfamily)